MATTTTLAAFIHDTIDEVTTTVERVHRSIAELPFDAIGQVPPLRSAADEVRSLQGRSIGAVYALVRRINREVQHVVTELVTGAPTR